MLAFLRDGPSQTILCAATLRQMLRIKFSVSFSHNILTPGRPVPALTLSRQAPGRVASGKPTLKSVVTQGPGIRSIAQVSGDPGTRDKIHSTSQWWLRDPG